MTNEPNGEEIENVFEIESEVETQETDDEPSDPPPTFHDGEELVTPTKVKNEEIEFVEEGRQLEETVAARPMKPGRNIKRISCLSHTLQLVMGGFDKYRNKAGDGSSEAPLFVSAIPSAKKLVGKFNKSTTATSRLVDITGKKLVADVTTRWPSTYLLIHRLLQLRQQVTTVCEELVWNCVSISD